MTVADLEQKLLQNPNSPLFARLAKEYLADGRVEEAMQLCVAGLQLYPSYPTAHLVLAQCYHAEQNPTKALEYIHEARTLLPGSSYLSALYDEWSTQTSPQPIEQPPPEVIEEVTPQQAIQSPATEIIEEHITTPVQDPPLEVASVETLPPIVDALPLEDLAILDRMEISNSPSVEEVQLSETALEDQSEIAAELPVEITNEVVVPPPFEELVSTSVIEATQLPEPVAEEQLEIPAPALAEEPQLPEPITEERVEAPVQPPAEIPSVPPALETVLSEPAPKPLDDEGRIVSKTLAEIYVSQGAFAEAILTYQLLKMLRPAQSAEYDLRIKELELKVQDKTAQ